MNTSELPVWGSAVVLSLILHALWFYQWQNQQLGMDAKQLVNETIVTQLKFFKEKPQTPEQPKKKVKVKPKPKPKPKKIKPTPQKKLIVEAPEPILDQEDIVEQEQQEVVMPAASQPPSMPRSVDVTKQYLQKLSAHIESNKFYSQAAKRRGVTGKVNVSFVLNTRCELENLQVNGDVHSLLKRDAKQAINESAPFPSPDDLVELPLAVSFIMVYNLK